MLIVTAPIVTPISTANPPTEAVAIEAAKKTPVPKPTPSTDNPNTRNSTQNHEQPKNTLDLHRFIEPRFNPEEQKADPDKNSQEQQQKQAQDQQNKQEAQDKAQQSQDQRTIEQLKNIDRQVRAHETAHASVGGRLAGAPQLSFVTGPDGKRYANGGEVSIDTSKGATPESTISKMSQVRQAALAPANPSPQDLKVAAIASQVANQAQVELNIERNQEAKLARIEKADAESEKAEANQEEKPARKIYFTNPISARRSSLQLNQKIVNSGALDDYTQKPRISHSA